MASLEEIGAALKAADAAGNTEDAKALAAAYEQMQSQSPAAGPQEADWVTPGQGEPGVPGTPAGITEFTRSLYPVQKNVKTGELRAAVPSIIPAMAKGIADAFTLPGDVNQGKVDPLSEEGADRALGFASTFAGGLKPSVLPKVSTSAKNAARALADDELTAAGLPQALENLGPDAMVMDLGPNLQRQAGALASVPGKAQKTIRDAVGERSAGGPARVEADVARTIGSSPDLVQLTEQITASQKAVADPLYAAVRDLPIQVPPAMSFIAKSPLGQMAFRQAQELAANEGYTANGMTVGLADYAKRALDDIATSAARKGENNVARQARNMTKALTQAVDAQVPAYKRARDAFAGPARVLDALEQGQASFSKDMSPTQLKSTLDGLSPSEQDAFLAGARGSVEALLGNAVNEPLALRNLLRKGWNESKLRTLLGDDIANDLLKRIDREATFSKTRDVVTGNSETAARQAAQPEVAPQMADIKQVSILGLVFSAINKARAGVRGKMQPKVNDDLASILAATGQTIDPTALSELQRAMNPQPFLPAGARDLVRTEGVRQPVEERTLFQLKA